MKITPLQASDKDDEEGFKGVLKLLNRGTLSEVLAQYLQQRKKEAPQLVTCSLKIAAGASPIIEPEEDVAVGYRSQLLAKTKRLLGS